MSIDEIPVLATWKLYNNTISALLEQEFSEIGLQRLANIIITQNTANIFVYNHNNSIAYHVYQRIINKYKTFTRWFLGRLFYFSISDRITDKTSKILIDAQLCVLKQLSKTQLDVCLDILNEYLQIYQDLIDFIKNDDQRLVLNVFELDYNQNDLRQHLDLNTITVETTKTNSNDVLLRCLKFVKFILIQDSGYSIFNNQQENTKIFEDLLYLLSIGSIRIKLEIFQIYFDLLELSKFNNSLNSLILNNLNKIPLFLEQFILEVYDDKIQFNNNEDSLTFDNVVVEFSKILNDTSRQQLFHAVTQKDLNFTKIINQISNLNNCHILVIFKNVLKESINNCKQFDKINVYDRNICKVWSKFHHNFVNWCDTIDCDKLLEFLNNLCRIFIEIKLEIKSGIELVYFDENRLFHTILMKINQFVNYLEIDKICQFLIIIPFLFGVNNFILIVDLLMYRFIGNFSHINYKNDINDLLNLLKTNENCKLICLKSINHLIMLIASNLFLINDQIVEQIQSKYLSVIKQVMNTQDLQLQCLVIENLPHTIHVYPDSNDLVAVLQRSMTIKNNEICKKVLQILPTFICLFASDFTKTIIYDRDTNTMKLSSICLQCHQESSIENHEIYPKLNYDDLASFNELLLNLMQKNLTINDESLKISTLETLKYCYQHIPQFHSKEFVKFWIKTGRDHNENLRKKFIVILNPIIKSIHYQDEIVDVCMEEFFELTKISLKTDYNLQTTIIEICEILINNHSNDDKILRYLLKILIYLIMLPTSRHSLIAINKFFKLCELRNLTTTQLFKQYRDEICEIIIHLCSINLKLIGATIVNSLQKISMTFGYCNSKEFITLECRYLLPYLIGKIIKCPNVKELIEEIATILEIELSELLAQNYGHIFLKIFLNDTKENFKLCMDYMEKTSNSSGPVLRKRNLRIILNELLLKLHEKRDKVILALTLLTREDVEMKNNNNKNNIQDYLQPSLLGLLQHFDINLITKPRNKELVLSSFADFLYFMNRKYITPLRYKIFAMLRTIDYNDYPPQLYCNVWDAFINNCDIEMLGQQLATIFVSLLPLIPICQETINRIFKYLIIDNEAINKDYIKDLFFVNGTNNKCIDTRINTIIKKYTDIFNNLTLKETIREFLKYLQHETIEIRIYGMKHLKLLMEKNRKDLDKMILGYNGIDTIIIELIDILIHNCREKDKNLKSTCGELIGELGAIEPSHLPRIYTKNVKNFTFFINDDIFIINALNELTKACQREKNTHDMDRYALAIQEILKTYDISPNQYSKGNHIWRQFDESQQELMSPLLLSKYIMKHMPNVRFPCPVYGNPTYGNSFQSWLYNWTFSLIQTLSQQLQSNLNVCLPAMKQDHRILMSFLPHILLHSLSDGVDDHHDRVFNEINTVTTTFLNKQNDDNNNIRSSNPPSFELSEEILQAQQCTKIVFVIFDFLERWIREWQWQKGAYERNNTTFIKIKQFLTKFCKLHLSKCNYYCSEYPRALMYLEDYIIDNIQDVDNNLSFLAEIYAQLDESDGVAGVTALRRKQPPIEDRIRSLEVSGKLSEAICCYQQIEYPLKLQHIRGLIQCNLDLDNTQSALHIINGCIYNQCIEYGSELVDLQAEVFWRLGQFQQLDQLLNQNNLNNNLWGIQIGKVLLNFTNGNRIEFDNILNDIRLQQVEYLSAASLEEGSYQHGYNYITRLHILNEINQIEKTTNQILNFLNNNNNPRIIENLINNLGKEFELRIKVVQESIKLIEPILCLRRIILQQAKNLIKTHTQSPLSTNIVDLFNFHIGTSWLLSAKIARDAGNHLQAYNYLLKTEEYNLQELFLEKAKLYWSKNEYDEALKSLQNGLDAILPTKDLIDNLTIEQKRICSEAKLLIATYNDTLSYVNTEVNIINYKESIEIYKEWEMNLVCLGQYYDRIFQNLDNQECDSSKGSDMQIHIINYFGKSLLYGSSYIYQSMPRMLSIWFDYGTRLLNIQQTNITLKQERKNNLLRMTKLIDTFLERLPTYCFFTAISQIISRICHPQKEVYFELKSIIIKLLLEYPQHSLWMIISVIKSSYTVRAKRCSEILLDSRLKSNTTMQQLMKDFTDLAEKLIELCNKDVPPDLTTTTVSSLLRSLPRMLQNPNFSEIMIPTHKFRKLVLPNPDFSNSQHNPFPNHYVHIVGIDEEVVILRSLQRPRKIAFRGSDGKKYIQMLKPKDDLRKDFRLMEFNDIVNQLLSRESEARQKRLNIRLYSVSPLNEECGLIEWIPDLVGLRPVLMNLYKQRGLGMTARELKEASCNIRDPLSKKRDVFLKQFLPKHPPILGEWFRITFPDAQSWITARTAYIRTTAVMSMAGYILGLGDRHGENILLDSTNGDTVHVDFNCLFNKGETFEWPERVPFRLTHNMVSAMGPLGVEGIFRNSCACTLKVLRTNANTLMSLVTPFVYDPLVSWPRNTSGPSYESNNAERTNEQAFDHIKNIESRLKGIVKTRTRTLSIPLSVDGQTNHLINEAISVDNLCQMYVGWGPYM